MNTVNFVFGLHSHQPVGNFESVFEDSFRKSYSPFLNTFADFPEIKISLHYTGALFDWIVEKHPDYIKKLKMMIKRGQVEIMTGGYYEPILSIIPDHDKIGQIKSFTKRLEEVLETSPKGMWLAERVWEPHIPKCISQAGVKYTVVDDSHFRNSGLNEIQTLGYYITEELGHSIYVFPISEKMRYTIPFQPVQATIDYLGSVASEDGSRIVVMADDGEKFGVWPDTFKHVYENKWLENFLSELRRNNSWIKCLTFSEALEKFKPLGRTYLPTASYTEMMEWVLPAQTIHKYEGFINKLKNKNEYEDNKIFIKGGFWRNYFAKYPESNQIHKKMLFVSNKINEAEGEIKLKKDKNELEKAKQSLWRGQVNCGYWHGVFGGLYLPHLRKAIYENLIDADNIVEKIKHKKSEWAEIFETDLDVDGNAEVVYQSNLQNLYFKPNEGGILFEHDFLPANFNLIDTLSRKEEGYHFKVIQAKLAPSEQNDTAASIHDFIRTKELGLEKYLTYDWYRRASLIDHFIGDDTTIDKFHDLHYAEEGDFVNQPYTYKISKHKDKIVLLLSRIGAIYKTGQIIPVQVEKKITFPKDSAGLTADYTIINLYDRNIKINFGSEFNINFQAGMAPDRYYFGDGIPTTNNFLTSAGETAIPKEFGVCDEWLGIKATFKSNKNGVLWRFPIETVSLSEGGFERVYQSSVLLQKYEISLAPSEKWECRIDYIIENLKR